MGFITPKKVFFYIKKYKKIKVEKSLGTSITGYLNYTLTKSEVPNMYIVGGVGFGMWAKTTGYPT